MRPDLRPQAGDDVIRRTTAILNFRAILIANRLYFFNSPPALAGLPRWNHDDDWMIAERKFNRVDVRQGVNRLDAQGWIVNPYR